MAPPALGSEVNVIRTGVITRYNDNTANVKFNPGRGRPHKVPFTHFVNPPEEVECVELVPVEENAPFETSVPIVDQKALPSPRRRTSIISWATVITLGGAIGVGLFHGLGSKAFELAYHKLAPLLNLPI